MDERSLPKPEHLRDVPTSTGDWLAKRTAGIAAFLFGLGTFAVAAIVNEPMWSTPDWHITVPGFALTAIASLISMQRHEQAWGLWLVGIGLAGAAIVLGWVMLLAVVIGATVILMLIMHSVM